MEKLGLRSLISYLKKKEKDDLVCVSTVQLMNSGNASVTCKNQLSTNRIK